MFAILRSEPVYHHSTDGYLGERRVVEDERFAVLVDAVSEYLTYSADSSASAEEYFESFDDVRLDIVRITHEDSDSVQYDYVQWEAVTFSHPYSGHLSNADRKIIEDELLKYPF